MYIDMTRQDLHKKLEKYSTHDIISYFQGQGLTLKAKLPEIEHGVYRRLNGMDLIEYNGLGWKPFNPSIQDTGIVWGYGDDGSWIRVLDYGHKPIMNGMVLKFKINGERIG